MFPCNSDLQAANKPTFLEYRPLRSHLRASPCVGGTLTSLAALIIAAASAEAFTRSSNLSLACFSCSVRSISALHNQKRRSYACYCMWRHLGLVRQNLTKHSLKQNVAACSQAMQNLDLPRTEHDGQCQVCNSLVRIPLHV